MTLYAGSTNPIPERSSSSAYHRSDEIQLCVGAGEEPYKGESGGRGAVIARRVFDNEAFGHLVFFLLTLAFLLQRYIGRNLHGGENACITLRLVITRWVTLTRRRSSMVRSPARFKFFPPFRRLSCISPGLLIDKEPTNMQALSLASLIDNGVTRGSSPYIPSLNIQTS